MHYVTEGVQIPFNTAENGNAYALTTRYGAMCENNLRDGNFPMAGILEIVNPTEEMKELVERGILNFDRGLPKEPKSCAVRGRETSDGTVQQLEIGTDIANALTTVQKDSMVLEPMILGYSRDGKGRVVSRHFNEIAGTLTPSSSSGGNTSIYVAEPAVMTDPLKELRKNTAVNGGIAHSSKFKLQITASCSRAELGCTRGGYTDRQRP